MRNEESHEPFVNNISIAKVYTHFFKKFQVATAVLSITAKQKKKEAAAKKATTTTTGEKMDVEEEKKDTAEKEKKDEKKEDKPEATFDVLSNPARVMKPQLAVLSLEAPAKYKPVKDISIGGIVMMKRVKSDDNDEEEEIVKPVEIKRELGEVEEEPEPPQPFEYTE